MSEKEKEPRQMTRQEKDSIPATPSGKKLLANISSVTSEFVRAFKEMHGGKYVGKLSTYTDGEPYYSSHGAEFSLRDYLKRKDELMRQFPNLQERINGM